MTDKISQTVSKTFFLAFIIINFFNLIPISLGQFSYILKVCMLIADTSSLYLISAVVDIYSFGYFNSKLNSINNREIKNDFEQPNKISAKKRAYLISIFFYLIIIFISTFNIFYGFNRLENRFMKKIAIIEQQEDFRISQLKDIKEGINLSEDVKNLQNQKNNYIQILSKDLSKKKFIHFKESVRVLILCLIWAFGFFRLYKFVC